MSAFDSVVVDYNGSRSRSCKIKHETVAKMIQCYIDDLQKKWELPSLNYEDITETGGASKDEDVTKWWFLFWDGQPGFWYGLKQTNGKEYACNTLVRYMGAVRSQLKKKFTLSKYLDVIVNVTYKPAQDKMKAKAKDRKLVAEQPAKKKVYTSEDLTFILQRCLWLNSMAFIDFFVFQTLLLRLCSRGGETCRLKIKNLSIREHMEEGPNKIIQCYLVRDKNGVDWNIPLIPNKSDIFGDPIVAIGLALFVNDSDDLMPFASAMNEGAATRYYDAALNRIWTRYPPREGLKIRRGTSHFGKHTGMQIPRSLI